MKKFYLSLIVLTLLLLVFSNLVCVAIPKENSLAMKLEDNQDKWDLVMDNDFLSYPLTEYYEPKKDLVEFIRLNKNNYETHKEVVLFTVPILILSLIGYFRERSIRPKVKE
ncbi:hypothetical protein ACFL38_02845 [Candidatus Omnitrophota bacterium]